MTGALRTWPAIDPADLAARFEAQGPWVTRIEVDGAFYGRPGGAIPTDVEGRPARFFEWAGVPSSILELGSLEGSHTVHLARPVGVERLTALEARADSVRRARFVNEVLGFDHVTVAQADLEECDLTSFGTFDAVYCAGLLYHLSRPWLVLAQLATVAPILFLDTHVSDTGYIEINGYRGRMYGEFGVDDAFSGMRRASFWPDADSLGRMVVDVGYAIERTMLHPNWPNGTRVWHLCRSRVAPGAADRDGEQGER